MGQTSDSWNTTRGQCAVCPEARPHRSLVRRLVRVQAGRSVVVRGGHAACPGGLPSLVQQRCLALSLPLLWGTRITGFSSSTSDKVQHRAMLSSNCVCVSSYSSSFFLLFNLISVHTMVILDTVYVSLLLLLPLPPRWPCG